jgi:hypothetical protein
MFQTIWHHRLSRWAAIFIVVNAWVLFTTFVKYSHADRLMTIWPEASNVQPYFNADSGELSVYKVNVSPDEIAKQARWPKYGEICGLAALNIAILAWLLRLSITESRTAPSSTEPV